MTENTISIDYKNELIEAEKFSIENSIRFNTNLNLNQPVSYTDIFALNCILNERFKPNFSLAIPGYWGDRCLDLSANIYMFLRKIGIECEIVYGDIDIDGNIHYGTETEPLMDEHKCKKLGFKQIIHSWITVGDDTIIDGSINDMLKIELKWTKNLGERISVDRASEVYTTKKITYKPMFIGAEFLCTTNTFFKSLFFD